MQRYLTILEVSQKQAYIFASNKLKENIVNSEVITRILSSDYLKEVLKDTGYSDEKNMVYSGGGHAILEFAAKEKAYQCVAKLTEIIYRDFDGLLVFARTILYDEKELPRKNIKKLTCELERKKEKRLSYFHQGSYGVEKIDSTTLGVLPEAEESEEKKKIRENEYEVEKSFYPEGKIPVTVFDELGGSRDESNFIAVIHVDGNGMGKRMDELYDIIGVSDWDTTKAGLRKFSDSIDADFKQAFRNMANIVGRNQERGKLKALSIENNHFPLRRIITAGDDICFVAEGRIGIECAVIFIEELNKISNEADHKPYTACAGVALVHAKFPFYKAYKLAEQLCSSAKAFGSNLSPQDNGRSVSSIDWHIEFGEMGDSLEDIRRNYINSDGNLICMRPYLVTAPDEIIERPEMAGRKYSDFKQLITLLKEKEDVYPTGKIKGLHGALKAGETAVANYLRFNRMEELLADANAMFDAIELMDTYLSLERGE